MKLNTRRYEWVYLFVSVEKWSLENALGKHQVVNNRTR